MGSDRITIIRGRNDGTLDWRGYRRGQPAPMQQGAVASAGEALPAAITGKRAGAVTLALPASQVVTRVMKLPLQDPVELAGAVALQVDKFSPFPVEQMVYSYEVLAQGEEETTVLIAISQRTSVGAWGDALRQTGADIVRVDSAALGQWHVLQTEAVPDAKRRESFLLVDEDEIVLITHDGGTLLSVSGLGQPEDFADPALCADLAEEVARILMETDAENGPGHEPVLFLAAAQGREPLGALADALKAAVGIAVAEYRGKAFPDAAAGVLQRSMRMGDRAILNLVPAEWVRDAASLRLRNTLIVVGCGVLGLWLLLLAGGWGYLAWQRARLENLREAEQQWLRPANVVRGMRLQVNLIDRYRDRSQSALESLREISSIQPQGVDLISFTYRKGEGIELIGEADSGALVLQFNQRLNESEVFGDVRPGTRTRTRQGRHRFSFDIFFGEVAP